MADKWFITDKATGETRESSLNSVMEHARERLGTKAKARNLVTQCQQVGTREVDGFVYECKRGVS